MISLVLATMLMAADPSSAPAATPAATAPAKQEKPAKEKLVCKKEPVLGSRMPTRVCLTQEEWDQRKQDSRDVIDQAQRNIPLNGN